MASRQLEETLDVRCVFRALRAFPRHAPVQAELTAPTDGAHGPYFGHRYSITSSARAFPTLHSVHQMDRQKAQRRAVSAKPRRCQWVQTDQRLSLDQPDLRLT